MCGYLNQCDRYDAVVSQIVDDNLRAFKRAVREHNLVDAAVQQPHNYCTRSTARSKHNGPLSSELEISVLQRLYEAVYVGVVADEAAIQAGDRVDRTNALSDLGALVYGCVERFLVRHGDIDTDKLAAAQLGYSGLDLLCRRRQ